MQKNLFKYSFSVLHVDYVKLNHSWNYNNVISPYYRLYYIDDGEGYISGVSESLILEPGYIYIIPSFTICNLRCNTYLSQYFIQFFEESPNGISLFHNNRTLFRQKASERDIDNFKRILQLNPGRGINRSDNPKVYEKQSFYREYQSLNDLMKPSSQFETQGILLQLLSGFLDSCNAKTGNPINIPSRILNAMNYIQTHLDQNPTVKELAEKANQNEDYFSRQFLLHTGLRPLQYIREKRIERAQYLITTTDKTFLEIATETGFANLPHFSNTFKRISRLTPGEYRNQSTLVK